MPKKQGITKGRLESGDLDKILQSIEPSVPLSDEARSKLEQGLITLLAIFGSLSELRRRFPPGEKREKLEQAKNQAEKLLASLNSGVGFMVLSDHSARIGAGPFPELTGGTLPAEANDNVSSAVARSFPAIDWQLYEDYAAFHYGLRTFIEEADRSIARAREVEAPSLAEFRLEFARALGALYRKVFNLPTDRTRDNHWELFLANVLWVVEPGRKEPIDAHAIWIEATRPRAEAPAR